MRFFTKPLLAAPLFAVALISSLACASGEQITVTQASDRSILVTLSGYLGYCDFSFNGLPTSSVTRSSITITSNLLIGECPPPPPRFVPPSPTPYSFTVDLGKLPDGSFSVTWSFVPALTQPLQTFFLLQAGVLPGPAAVPALSPIAYAILLLLLTLSYLLATNAHVAVRSRRQGAEPALIEVVPTISHGGLSNWSRTEG